MSKLMRRMIAGASGIALGFAAGAVFDYGNLKKVIRQKEAEIRRCKENFNTLNQWLQLIHGNKSVADYLLKNGCRTVAVYGLGELGYQLCRELCNTEVCVKYGIDRNAGDKEAGDFGGRIYICDLNHEFESIDAVIVTVPHAFKSLQGILSEKFGCPVLDLERILFEAEREV